MKDFKKKIKDATGKTLTLGQEVWMQRVNPIIRGKVNFYLYPFKAIEKNKLYGIESHYYLNSISKKLDTLDAYTRQRLRVCMIHKHPGVRKGFQMVHKWSVEYFCHTKLIPSNWLYYNRSIGLGIEQYIENHTKKWKKKREKQIERLKSQGKEYYTKERLRGIAINKGLVTT